MATSSRTIKCENCGVNLPLEENQKIIECEYCGTHGVVPPDFWSVHPVAARQDVAGPAREPVQLAQPAGRAKSGNTVSTVVVIALVALIGSGLAAFSIVMKRGSGGGSPLDPGAADVVTPSFAAADGIATARKADARVRKDWRPAVDLTTIYLAKVRSDGTMDLESEDGASLSMSFHDRSGLGSLLPGETEIKGAIYHFNVAGNYAGGSEGDLWLSSLDDAVYLVNWPGCSLTDLWKSAMAAGYPDRGFANVRFPDVPHALERENFAGNLRREPDAEALAKKLETMEWDETPYHGFFFYIDNFDPAVKLPRYFNMTDCSVMDEDALVEAAIGKIRASP